MGRPPYSVLSNFKAASTPAFDLYVIKLIPLGFPASFFGKLSFSISPQSPKSFLRASSDTAQGRPLMKMVFSLLASPDGLAVPHFLQCVLLAKTSSLHFGQVQSPSLVLPFF